MTRDNLPFSLRFSSPFVAAAIWSLGACATPASAVKVPTMPMQEALDRTRDRGASTAADPPPAGSVTAAAGAAAAEPPRPIITMPDVRLAYLYEWVDGEGNRHFGGWVAIAVTPPRWILSDGDSVTIEARPNQPPTAHEKQP
jgi:hypothetical protein